MSLIDIEDWREMIRILRFLERFKTNAIAIAILISILLTPTFVIADEFDTIVYIDPSDQIVSPEENFTVTFLVFLVNRLNLLSLDFLLILLCLLLIL